MNFGDGRTVDALIKALSDDTNAQSPDCFPMNKKDASLPGLYSWWADEAARAAFGEQLCVQIPPLVYVGQAGATRWPSGRRSNATLASRISSNHINGNASSSTFRLSLSALLLSPLELSVVRPGRLALADRAVVSTWIQNHLRVAIVPYADSDSLADVEDKVLDVLDPPLNLAGRPPTAFRDLLTHLRRQVQHP